MKETKTHITLPNSTPSEELYRFGADGNLRLYSYDRLFYSLYGYDGGTTRTYKYSFDLNPNWVNGRLEAVNFNMHNAMFYPNSYLNFNNDGHYTKHYYNGMERIASRLGDQNLPINVNDPELQDRKDQLDSNIRRNIVEITGYEFLPVGEEQTLEDPKPIYELPVIGISNLLPSADGIYYYHSNHLGSKCYVTDENRSVVQGFLYAPFGEITNEYNSGWQNGTLPKYSFNAKELDEETGMYYYEARYYQPPTFTSRDALFEEKPWITPYHYCSNNPVVRVDPSGMLDDEWQYDPTAKSLSWISTKGGDNVQYISVGEKTVAINTTIKGLLQQAKSWGLSIKDTPILLNVTNSHPQSDEKKCGVGWGFSIDINLTIVGGYSIEFGYVQDASGDGSLFFSHGNTGGFEASIGLNGFVIPNSDFKLDDFSGQSMNTNVSISYFSIGVISDHNRKLDTDCYFEKYCGVKLGVGFGYGGSTANTKTTFTEPKVNNNDNFVIPLYYRTGHK